MSFSISPAVNVTEIDLTTVVPQVSTTEGAISGVFRWGPLDKRVLIDSESYLAAVFGKPTNHNAETWFTAASFLAYGNQLYVVRAANTTSVANGVLTAIAVADGANAASVNALAHVVKNEDHYETLDGTFHNTVQYLAKYAGELGNSLRISVCESTDQFSSSISLAPNSQVNATTSLITCNIASNSAVVDIFFAGSGDITTANTLANSIKGQLSVGDLLLLGNTTIGQQYAKISALGNVSTNSTAATFSISFDVPYRLKADHSGSTIERYWEFFNVIDVAPSQSDYVAAFGNTSADDELHVVVVDNGGKFTGVPGSILESFRGLSRATDAKTPDGGALYYKTVINQTSKFVWFANDRTNAVSNTATNITSSTNSKVYNATFVRGADGDGESDVALAVVATGYDKFVSAEDVDISLIMVGKNKGGINGEALANYLIDNIAEVRKDCVVFVSPEKDDVVNNSGGELEDILQFRNGYNNLGGLRSTSYAFLDSGYKYMYDKYNDVYRWIPLNGDMAGLCVRTDTTNDAWWSPAGFNRGFIKNYVRLAYNPRKAERDQLYKSNVNPVVSFPGQGVVLFGDKTLLTKPSAFDRINVRRLFIVLEKAIATAAKYTLFEFNDTFTRAQFKNMVTPYLRDVKGRRGITDFHVVCDESNNTAEIIDTNRFVGDIYIKPARSINFINLNFIAVRTGVQFSEVIGNWG